MRERLFQTWNQYPLSIKLLDPSTTFKKSSHEHNTTEISDKLSMTKFLRSSQTTHSLSPPKTTHSNAEFHSALNARRIRLNPSGIANPDRKYPLDRSKNLVFRGYQVLFGRWPPGPRAPFDAEFNSALNPSRIRLNPSEIANPDTKYPLDRSKKHVFCDYRVLFGGWPADLRSPFDAEFDSALNPSWIRLNPSRIANPERKCRIWC